MPSFCELLKLCLHWEVAEREKQLSNQGESDVLLLKTQTLAVLRGADLVRFGLGNTCNVKMGYFQRKQRNLCKTGEV